jgi:hypothetical protein
MGPRLMIIGVFLAVLIALDVRVGTRKGAIAQVTPDLPSSSHQQATAIDSMTQLVIPAPLYELQIVRADLAKFRDGRQTFRFDTFGDESFWGDVLQLHKAIEGATLGAELIKLFGALPEAWKKIGHPSGSLERKVTYDA